MEWTAARVTDLLDKLRRRRGDSTTVEVKRAAAGVPKSLPETICAFANMPGGGTIILGADEHTDFSINGVEDPAAMEAAVANQARQFVTPSPYLEATSVEIQGVMVTVVQVTGLNPLQKPATYKGEAYLRQADGDYVMGVNDLHMIEIAKLHSAEAPRYDAMAVEGTSADDLDRELTQAFLRAARRTSRRLSDLDADDLLAQMGVTHRNGSLTHAGLYALGRYPQGRLPALGVTAAVNLPREPGSSSARTRDLRHFDGPLPALLEDVMDWVVANLSAQQVYDQQGHLRDQSDLPLRAIREAVANALVHRDMGPDTLGVGKRVELRLLPDKLLILSPGGLRGVTKSQLISASSLTKAAVNQQLYEIAKLLKTDDGARVIEGEGGGVKEILLSTREAGFQTPHLIDTGVEFKVILWRVSPFTREEDEWLKRLSKNGELSYVQKELLASLLQGDEWSVERLTRDFSPLTVEEATEVLSQLTQRGLVLVDLDATPQISLGRNSTGGSRLKESAPAHLLGKNGGTILGAVGEGAGTVPEMIDATGLTRRQVEYALKQLLSAGLLVREGGQGHRGTFYRLPG